jgi:cell division protein ZapA (FtsZ GTPase activity inhibitor)
MNDLEIKLQKLREDNKALDESKFVLILGIVMNEKQITKLSRDNNNEELKRQLYKIKQKMQRREKNKAIGKNFGDAVKKKKK